MIRESVKLVPVEDPPIEATMLLARTPFWNEADSSLNAIDRWDTETHDRIVTQDRQVSPLQGYDPRAGVDLGSIG